MRWHYEHVVRKVGRTYRWPFSRMLPGDYLIVPRPVAAKASRAAYIYGKRVNKRFTCGSFGTNGRILIRLEKVR